MPQPARRQLRPSSPGRPFPGEGAAARVRRRCAFHVPAETRRAASTSRHRAAVHADVPHSSEGALERRRAGHRGRLRLHARRTSGAGVLPAPGRAGSAPARPKRGGHSTRRRCVSRSASRSRTGRRCSRTSYLGTYSWARTCREIWVDRIDDPRTGEPIGSGPFLVESFERGKAAHARPEPPLLGTAPRVRVDRLVASLSTSGATTVDALRKGDVDIVIRRL